MRCRSRAVFRTMAARLPSGDNTGALPALTGVPGTGDTSPVSLSHTSSVVATGGGRPISAAPVASA